MGTSMIRSRQEAVERLHSDCNEALACLRKMNAVHLATDYPERTVASSEPECVLRLRKVYFHIRAVTSWPVATDNLHVMGPDIRTAMEHLELIVERSLCGLSDQSELEERRKYAARKEKQLSRFSHPTLPILTQPWNVGGLDKADTIMCLLQLYGLLISVVADYGRALSEMAEFLEPSRVSEIVELMERANERCALFPRDVVLGFVENRTCNEPVT